MRDVLKSGSVSCFGNSDFRPAQNLFGFMKAHGKKILIRCSVGQGPELTVELCAAHCHFAAEVLNIVQLVAEVSCHSLPYFMQEGISLFDVDFVMTDHFLMNTLLIRAIDHPVIRPCKAFKFHNTADLSQKGMSGQDTKNPEDGRRKTEGGR